VSGSETGGGWAWPKLTKRVLNLVSNGLNTEQGKGCSGAQWDGQPLDILDGREWQDAAVHGQNLFQMDVVGYWDGRQQNSLQIAKTVDHGRQSHGTLALVRDIDQFLVADIVDPQRQLV
jgi:hypothetical protein